MVTGFKVVNVIKSLNELDMRVLGFLPRDLEKSGVICLENVPDVKEIAEIFEPGTEELRDIQGKKEWLIDPNVNRDSEQDLEACGIRLTIGINDITGAAIVLSTLSSSWSECERIFSLKPSSARSTSKAMPLSLMVSNSVRVKSATISPLMFLIGLLTTEGMGD